MAGILGSLVGNYTDSEGEEEVDREENGQEEESMDKAASLVDRLKEGGGLNTPGSGGSSKSTTPTKKSKGLVAYNDPDADLSDEDRESVPMELESDEEDKNNEDADGSKTEGELEKSHLMEELWVEGVQLPPEPQGQCSADLQEKIERMWRRKVGERIDFNAMIQNKKAFRNPSIYEKLIIHMNIDELGTNFPPELYDGHLFGKESFYDELSKQQQGEMDKIGKAVEAKKKLGDANVQDALKQIQKRNSKWDQGASAGGGGAGLLPGALAAATLAKTIPAFGALKKK